MSTYRLPGNHEEELRRFAQRVGRHLEGKSPAAELKAYRVPFGIYEQRENDTYMVRIRCAAGMITPGQLRRVAELAGMYGSGRLHLTTRQEVQIHDVALENVVAIIGKLAEVNLSTRGGGGNTVRNITASRDAGISSEEPFDVTPYAVELTSRLIARPDSWLLPRKYKIAFSNTSEDTAYAMVNDLGFIAKIKDGVKGFSVYVAGGLGRRPQAGHLLHEFIPAGEVFLVAEAIKQLFMKHGNHRNRHNARLRFLWNSLGRERFIELYEVEKRELEESHESLIVDRSDERPGGADVYTAGNEGSAELIRWRERFVSVQPDGAYVSVRIPVELGDISSEAALSLAEICRPLGDDVIRFTQSQNIHLRNIPWHLIENIYKELSAGFPLMQLPRFFGNAVACTGADTCKLGICLSRNALVATLLHLEECALKYDGLPELRLHFSGCPNSCGQHPIADIGFYGKAARRNGKLYPAYSVVAGARLNERLGTSLAGSIGEVPARNVPDLVEKILGRYLECKGEYPDFAAFIKQEGAGIVARFVAELATGPAGYQDTSLYSDWGESGAFSVEKRGTGECSAGLMDLLENNMARIRQMRTMAEHGNDKGTLAELLRCSAGALLVTQGIETVDEEESVALFLRHFIPLGVVPDDVRELLEKYVSTTSPDLTEKDRVLGLSHYIEELYRSMDDTLKFHPEIGGTENSGNSEAVAREVDLRGVSCPMNFVKTKLALSQIGSGDILRVLLDDGAPVENVPQSVREEGHEVLRTRRTGTHWNVDIRKGGV